MGELVELSLPQEEDFDWDPNIPWYDYQLADHGGLGLMTQYGAMTEENFEAYEFIEFQFKRFGYPVPDPELTKWCWNFAFYAVDQVDPYLLFHGITDVFKCRDALFKQFEVRENEHEDFREISGDSSEFFRLYPDKLLENFPLLYNNPGLKNFDSVYDYFNDHVGMIMEGMHEGYYPEEVYLIRRYGAETAKKFMELGVWAAMIWMISPEPDSRNWRYSFHPIFQLVYDHGSCLLDDWTFYKPGLFKIHDRPVKSCSECGTHEWCVELTQRHQGGKVAYICQSCISDGEPFPGMTCGTKMCSRIECKNHPSHHVFETDKAQREIRKIEADARYGALKQLPNGMVAREMPGMIAINSMMMDKYSRSIADDMGQFLSAMLSPPEK